MIIFSKLNEGAQPGERTWDAMSDNFEGLKYFSSEMLPIIIMNILEELWGLIPYNRHSWNIYTIIGFPIE